MQQCLSKQPADAEPTAAADNKSGGQMCGPVSWHLASALVMMCVLALVPFAVGPRQVVAWSRSTLHAAQRSWPEPPGNATMADYPNIATLAESPNNATMTISMTPDDATMASARS